MQVNEKLFQDIKELFERAHADWGNFTAAGAAFEVLNLIDGNHDKKDQLMLIVLNSNSRIDAIKKVRSFLFSKGEESSLKIALDIVDDIKPKTFWS